MAVKMASRVPGVWLTRRTLNYACTTLRARDS